MKAGLPETPTWTNWLKELGPTTRVGVDPTVLSEKEAAPLATALATDPTRALVPIKENLVDAIWSDRPARPANSVFRLVEEYSGQSVADKLLMLRDKLGKIGSPGLVVSALDEVAWLFNLRGSDIPYNPVFFSYAIVTQHDTTLFANPASIGADVKAYLQKNNVAVLEYDKVWQALESWKGQLSAERAEKEAKEKAEREAAIAAAERGEPVPAKAAVGPAGADAQAAKPEEPKDPKLVKSDKVLIGNTASWAIADALGKENCEVRRSLIEDAKARKNAVSQRAASAACARLEQAWTGSHSSYLTSLTQLLGFASQFASSACAHTRPSSRASAAATSATAPLCAATLPGSRRFSAKARRGTSSTPRRSSRTSARRTSSSWACRSTPSRRLAPTLLSFTTRPLRPRAQ